MWSPDENCQYSWVFCPGTGLKTRIVSQNFAIRDRTETLTRFNFPPDQAAHYFAQAASHVEALTMLLPDLYGDFQTIETKPTLEMAVRPDAPAPMYFSRAQVERLVRDIDQVFEIRANSELEQPKRTAPQRVFISHGRSNDWRLVQPFIVKDVGLLMVELAQDGHTKGVRSLYFK